jgi:hypothetical protein
MSEGNAGMTTDKGGVNMVRDCEGWRTPDMLWLDVEAAEEGDMYFVNMVTAEQGKDE